MSLLTCPWEDARAVSHDHLECLSLCECVGVGEDVVRVVCRVQPHKSIRPTEEAVRRLLCFTPLQVLGEQLPSHV